MSLQQYLKALKIAENLDSVNALNVRDSINLLFDAIFIAKELNEVEREVKLKNAYYFLVDLFNYY